MPRKTRTSAGTAVRAASPPAYSTSALDSPAASSGTTLVQALQHIPLLNGVLPKLPFSDDDLTPPPSPAPAAARSKRRRTAAKAVSYAEHAEDEGADEPIEAKPRTGRKKAAKTLEDEVEAAVDAVTTPKKGRKQAAGKKTSPGIDTDAVNVEEDGETPKRKTPKKSRIAVEELEYDEEGKEVVKKKKKVREYPKIEYDIPAVERKETTFKGRLGYACLNTVLRNTKPDSIFCSRTCRIASIEEEGMELPKGLATMNVRDLMTMIEWNEQNKIRFLRLSSEMFPFASHAKYGYDLSFVAAELKEAGDLANKYGHRITMHPGQFTQLGSPRQPVIDASVRELEYQCEILDRMGINQDGVMIIHMGGVFGDKPTTLERFKGNYTTRLSDAIKARLVLENDEICYNVDDLFPVSEQLNIPIIFDYHHDWINPSSQPPGVLIPRIAEVWKRKGIKIKQHLSEPRPGAESVMERRAHADRCKSLPADLPDDMDLMIEAKDKEQAVFELYRIYGLEDVIHDNLRPPDPEPSMRTKGRKSSLKKKVKQTGEVDSEGNSIDLSDVEKEGDGDIGDESLPEANMKEVVKKLKRKASVRKGKVTEESLKEEPEDMQEVKSETLQPAVGTVKGQVGSTRRVKNGKKGKQATNDNVDARDEEVKQEVEEEKKVTPRRGKKAKVEAIL